MSRQCKAGLIEEICKLYEGTEVPAAFALWSGLFAINACLKRDCFIDQGHFTVYPNLYLVLTAGSGICRKSTAIYVVTDLLNGIDPPLNIISQRITPSELIGTLSQRSVKDQILVNEAVGCFLNDELSTLIDKSSEMRTMIPLLTKLYDGKNFDYSTRAHGKELVKNPCLSIFGGSTVRWIKESIPTHAIGGGFTARIIFVYQDRMGRKIPWSVRTIEDVERSKRIVHDLNAVSKIRGPMGVTKEAIALYSKEYLDFLNGPLAHGALTSRYAARRHVNLLKIAMALSASKRDTREIVEEDVLRAIMIMRSSETGRGLIMRRISSEPVGDLCEDVMTLIITAGTIKKSDLIYEMSPKITHKDLNTILEGFVESEHVRKIVVGGKVAYQYIKKNGGQSISRNEIEEKKGNEET